MGLFGFGKKKHGSQQENSKISSSQKPTPSINFDVLVKEAQESRDDNKLWGAVYSLPEWYLVARGEHPDIRPFVGVVGGKPYIFAFTEAEGAREFAIRQGIASEDGSSHILGVPIPGFVQSAPAYSKQGVFGLLFNDGPHGFFAPLQNLNPMLQYFHNK